MLIQFLHHKNYFTINSSKSYVKELLFSNPVNKHENELNANFGNGISIYLNVLIEIQNYGNLIFKKILKENKNLNR